MAKNCEILLVEDSITIQEIVKTHLEETGYKVHTTKSMEGALEILNSKSIDLVLSDVMIESKGAQTGYHILKHIKNTSNLKNIPVIIMTDRRGSETAQVTAKRLGAYGFLKKPFKMTELSRILKKALQEAAVS